jgi:secondary thiamine-phosphate synthase enzyme
VIEQSFRGAERSSNPYRLQLGKNGFVVLFEAIETKTGGRFDALDITNDVLKLVESSGVRGGNVLVFSPHTTCCVVITETGNGTLKALERTMETLAPRDEYYAHDDLDIRTENLVEEEPANAPAHIFHVFAGSSSESIPIVDGVPALGEGQRILFLELDSSRSRKCFIQVVGE